MPSVIRLPDMMRYSIGGLGVGEKTTTTYFMVHFIGWAVVSSPQGIERKHRVTDDDRDNRRPLEEDDACEVDGSSLTSDLAPC